jgi:SAM-dependent methyltransferase
LAPREGDRDRYNTNSVRQTEKLKRKYSLDNLEVIAVERAGELGRSFDHVVSTGVLHHLPDPDAGLRSLRDVLEPNGSMHLMVYAPYGRAGVYLLQEYCRRLGIGTTPSEIRDLAASLRTMPPNHPLVPLRNALDFENEAALADALLHPRDRPYSVPQLFDFIRDGGLQFGRWLRQAPYLPQCGALASSPHQPLLRRLPAHEQYAAVEFFRGAMIRHSAIVLRNDLPGNAQPIRFDHDTWIDYVPLPMPDTVCVEERLPPGAAAVLINRNHTSTDLYLPVDMRGRNVFDAIDGERTIGEIAREQLNSENARALFERLWQYDQVIFDASRRDDPQNQ